MTTIRNLDIHQLHARPVAPSERCKTLILGQEDCVKLIEPDGTIGFINFNGMCAMQIDDAADVLGEPWDGLWPQHSRDTVRAAVRAAARGKTARFVAECPTALGQPARWSVTTSGIADVDGEVQEIIAISRITVERSRQIEIS